MKAGDLIELSEKLCVEPKGARGVLIHAPGDKGSSHLCVIFENGNYIYVDTRTPLSIIGYAPRYVCDQSMWKSLVSNVVSNGLGLVVQVIAWQYNGGGGFDWYPANIDIAMPFSAEKDNCVKYSKDGWECCSLLYIVNSSDAPEQEIDQSLWEHQFNDYPNYYKCA